MPFCRATTHEPRTSATLWTTASGCSASIRRSAGSTWISSKRPRRPRHPPGRNCPRRWDWRCVWASLPAWAWPCIGNGRTSGCARSRRSRICWSFPSWGSFPSMASPNQTPAIRGQKVRISPDSREAEAFRSLRTAIFHRAPKGTGRTILVTSATAERRQEHGGRQPGHHHGLCRAESGGGGRQPAATGTIRAVRHEPQRQRADLRRGGQHEPGRGHRAHQDRQSHVFLSAVRPCPIRPK